MREREKERASSRERERERESTRSDPPHGSNPDVLSGDAHGCHHVQFPFFAFSTFIVVSCGSFLPRGQKHVQAVIKQRKGEPKA